MNLLQDDRTHPRIGLVIVARKRDVLRTSNTSCMLYCVGHGSRQQVTSCETRKFVDFVYIYAQCDPNTWILPKYSPSYRIQAYIHRPEYPFIVNRNVGRIFSKQSMFHVSRESEFILNVFLFNDDSVGKCHFTCSRDTIHYARKCQSKFIYFNIFEFVIFNNLILFFS